MPYITRGDVLLYYKAEGEGLPIIFLHGYAGTSADFDSQVAFFSHSYRTIVLDFRCHGYSEKLQRNVTFEELVEDIRHLIRELNLPKPVLVGHSMGGRVAAYFAGTYPDEPQALVLIDSKPTIHEKSKVFVQTEFPYDETGCIVYTEEFKQRCWQVWDALDNADARPYYPRIHVPTLALFGDRGRITDVQLEQALREMGMFRIPHLTWRMIHNADHSVQVDQPQATNQAILEFLQGLSLPGNAEPLH